MRSVVPTVVLVAALGLILCSCGRKAPPQPPVIQRPARTVDVRTAQIGSDVAVTWSYPSYTTAGSVLPALERIEVWRAELPLSQEPDVGSTRDRALVEQLLTAQGSVIVELHDQTLVDATRGNELRITDQLEAAADSKDVVLWYAVRSFCCGGRSSDLSNIARLEPAPRPDPPQGLNGTPTVDGIVLQWEGTLPVLVERASSSDGPWQPLTSEPVQPPQWTDTTAEQETSWWYRLRSAVPPGTLLVGLPSDPVAVEYPDVYPPRTPEELICLPEGRAVRLRWQPSPTADFYRISRQGDERSWIHLSYHHRTLDFIDEDPPLGSLTYVVKAVDGAGNESDAVRCTTVVVATP